MQKFKIIKRVWRLLSDFHGEFYLQTFFTFYSQISLILNTVIIGLILSGIATKNLYATFFNLSCLTILYIVDLVLDYFKGKQVVTFGMFGLSRYLKSKSLKTILSLNYTQIIANHSAYNQAVINKGEMSTISIVNIITSNILPYTVLVVFSVFSIAYYIPLLAFIFVISILLLSFNEYKYLKKFIVKIDEYNTGIYEQSKKFAEVYTHFGLIKLLAVSDFYIENKIKNEDNFINKGKKIWLANVNHFTKRGILVFVFEVFILSLTCYYYWQGRIAIGTTYVIFSLVSKIFSNVAMLVRSSRDLPLKLVEVNKYLDLVYIHPEVDERGIKDIDFSSIDIHNLSFFYSDKRNYTENTSNSLPNHGLKNINLKINKGELVAIVGPSGAGKSTLVKILLRAFNYNKNISSVKFGGYELCDIDTDYLRRSVGYVSQDLDILDDTLERNILISTGTYDTDRNKYSKIIDIVNLKDFEKRVAGSNLGEKGIRISGGEKQRISIARALIKDPKLIILDEPTSGLDGINEREILDAIYNYDRNMIVITITHKLSTIQSMDKIFVMKHGEIVAEGNHSELYEKSEDYRSLLGEV